LKVFADPLLDTIKPTMPEYAEPDVSRLS
jgi:hypothetical protein